MKRYAPKLVFIIVSLAFGLLITSITSFYVTNVKAIIIAVPPDICNGPTVIGYACPEVSAKAMGRGKGLPFNYKYKSVKIGKQYGITSARTLKETGLNTKNFVADIAIWTLISGLIYEATIRPLAKKRKHKI